MTGQEIKTWRLSAGLTQAQLAERLGVTSNTVARWERNEMSPPAHLDLSLRNVKRESPPEYITRIMNEFGLTYETVSRRSAKTGYGISASKIHSIVAGKVNNPGIETVKALAAGLGRPDVEVFYVFGAGENAFPRDSELEAVQLNYSRLSHAHQRELRPIIDMLSREILRLLKEQD